MDDHMDNQTSNARMSDRPTSEDQSVERRAYRKPTLVVYGDLGRITRNDPAGAGDLDGTFVPPDNFYKTS